MLTIDSSDDENSDEAIEILLCYMVTHQIPSIHLNCRTALFYEEKTYIIVTYKRDNTFNKKRYNKNSKISVTNKSIIIVIQLERSNKKVAVKN